MARRAWTGSAAAGTLALLLAFTATAQPADPPPALTSEVLPGSVAELTAAAPADTPTRRPTRRPTATEVATATPTADDTATPIAATATASVTTTATQTATAAAAFRPSATQARLPALVQDWSAGTALPLLAGALLAALCIWLGAQLARAGHWRHRRRARQTLATAMLIELRRVDAVLRRVVALDNPASFPSLDHPIMEAALRDLTVFHTETAARIAQFHGALRGIQAEIGEYRDNPLRWAGRLAELNQLIKSRAASACRATPALIQALQHEGGTPPPHLGETAAPPSTTALPPSPFGQQDGDDWTL